VRGRIGHHCALAKKQNRDLASVHTFHQIVLAVWDSTPDLTYEELEAAISTRQAPAGLSLSSRAWRND
jgi:hypothetical protein